MFPLLRYFSLTSALAIVAVTAVLVMFYRQSAVSELIASAETHNASLARSFANTIWPDFADHITTVDEDGDSLRQRPETSQLHKALRNLTDGLPVLKVKIYNLDGLTVYSSQASQMGENKGGNPGFLMAREEAKPASKLSFRDTFSAFSGAVENRDLVESYVPVLREDGAVEGVLEIYTDVTPLMAQLDRNTGIYAALFLLICTFLYGVLFVIVRRADGILKKQYLELEHEIAERQQAEAALRTAKEAAETANRTKSEFLAMVSHEVRTPMNGVLGMAGLLLDSELPQEQREYANTIQDSGKALMTLINDILDFSKAEAGKIELEEIEFDLVSLVDNVVELLGPQAASKGIGLGAYLAPGIPRELRGDDGRIRQILLNLIGNAVKFTSSGCVSLEITLAGEPSADAGIVLRFAVNDTGIGIPTEAQEKIFGAFTQADSSTTRRHGGTGLGLAICEKLVTLMGGEIGVRSEIGCGSEFWFTVPLKLHGSGATPWATGLAKVVRGRRVLVLDDNEMIRRVFERQLTALGMEVTGAAQVEAGLSFLRRATQAGTPFDMAIVDDMLRGTDGANLAGRIRSEASIDVEILILSSSSGRIDTDRNAQELCFDAALPRPLCPGLLLKCLGRVLETDAADAAARGKTVSKVPTEPTKMFRILLAEDNPANQKVVTAMLTSNNFRIDAVGNGLEAIEALRNRPYDLALMDVGMPELDGQEATRQIRRMSGSVCEIPILAITAHAMKTDRAACMAAGMNDVITKPVDRTKLLEKIEFWLDLTPSGESQSNEPDESAEGSARRPTDGHRKLSIS